MLKGFEEITSELYPSEKAVLLPMLMAKLVTHKGQGNAITNPELIQYCATRGVKANPGRVRKVIEHIRQSNLLEGLIANKRGYFMCETPAEFKEWLETMEQRRNALDATIQNGMRVYSRMMRTGQTQLF